MIYFNNGHLCSTIAVRPCLSSDSLYFVNVFSSAPFVKPRGSKKPRGADDPTRSTFIESDDLCATNDNALQYLQSILYNLYDINKILTTRILTKISKIELIQI